MQRRFAIFLLFLLVNAYAQYKHPPFYQAATSWSDSILSRLTVEEKIAQSIMIAVYPGKGASHLQEVAELVSKYKVGGLIFFQGGPVLHASLINYFQSMAKVPLLIGIDGEWGLSMRLDSTVVYPKQITLGAIRQDTLIYLMGKEIAQQLRRTGIHMNFAPVVDINSNPRNPVIGSRSFGEDKYLVTHKALLYMRGLQDNHVLATAKHFPGHGDTDADSHYALPVITHSRERLDSIELYPFECLIRQGVGSIMSAHVAVPSLCSSEKKIPASLSQEILTGLLKNEMGYTGLVISDALTMKGVQTEKNEKPWETAWKAFCAGNDILLMPGQVPTVIGKICDAVEDSTLSETDINQRCLKILRCKKWLGLDTLKPVNLSSLYQDLNATPFLYTSQRLAEASLTLLKNEKNIIPLLRLDTLRIATLSIGSDTLSTFQQYCELYAPMTHFCVGKNVEPSVYDSLYRQLSSFSLVLAAIVNTDIRYTQKYGVDDNALLFLKRLSEKKKVIISFFASPYILSRLDASNSYSAIIMAYEDKDMMQRMVPQLIFGAISARGHLPVTVSNAFKAGDGIELSKIIRLKYTFPEEEGIDSRKLLAIDSIIYDAMNKKAFPGCQVLIARNGKVFYHKTFGYHTYEKKQAVKPGDIYDVASVTKVVATVPALIKLYDRHDISLNKKISSYFTEFKKSDKKNITLIDILLHQSGLPAWLPMYLSALAPSKEGEPLTSKKRTDVCSIRIHDFYLNNNTEYRPEIISGEKNINYPLQVASGLFTTPAFHDTILRKIKEAKLEEKKYRYSDLGFILLKDVIEQESGFPFDTFLYQSFYRPLGLSRTGFLPLTRHPENMIVPTENDTVFRKQLLRGYVHDENCAMLGGISGHAGLFSNANDLAIFLQMLLNGGTYGGVRYLNAKHIDYFTRCHRCPENRRGLGFDKPEPNPQKDSPVSRLASLSSYGHTGFTGCMVWVDPQSQLIFVFLSNKIHPDATNNKLVELNVRTKIQDVIYSLLSPQKEIPEGD